MLWADSSVQEIPICPIARKSPDNASIQFHVGMAYQKVNDSANAKQHLERVLKLDPNFVHADEVRSALNTRG